LPLTDGIIGPDGAMYFLTGGRRLDSDLYRVYFGDNTSSNAPLKSTLTDAQIQAQNTRKQLEKFHGDPNPEAVKTAWPYLKNSDRFIRYAARIAIEHQPVSEWQEKALSEKDPQTLTQAMIALARTGSKDLEPKIINALASITPAQLSTAQKIDVVRAFELTILRMGKPQGAAYTKLISYLNPQFPAKSNELNRLLSKVLVYVDAPQAVSKTMALMAVAKDTDDSGQKTFMSSSDLIARNPAYGMDIAGMLAKTPPAQQIYYATVLSEAKKGWTPALREKYFKWYSTAFTYKGGNSYIGFIEKARKSALENAPQQSVAHFNAISGNALLETRGRRVTAVGNPKGPGREWKMEEALAVVSNDSTDRNFMQGKMLFSATLCSTCHSMKGEGGAVGPDLTQLGTRFSNRDILESIIEPSKVISDQYAATDFKMKDGSTITGRLKNEENGKYYISMNPFSPQTLQAIEKKDVVSTKLSNVSIMFPGTINRLNKEEVKDLLAYLVSAGNKDHEVYKPKANKSATAAVK